MINKISLHACGDVYNADRIVCNMLKLASRVGDMSYSLYLAMYYYRTGRYNKALRVTYLTKQRLSQPYIMYNGYVQSQPYIMYYGYVNIQRYIETVGSLSRSRKMKTAWVSIMALYNKVHYIDELILEQEVSKQNGEPCLCISQFVLTEMLLVLSHYRLGNRSKYLQSLTDLQTLLLYDDGRYIPSHCRDLSWQILGICQNVLGDLHGALNSYQESLRQENFNNIGEASETRIMFVECQLHRNVQSDNVSYKESVQ
jgi:tetratricopeptide (TPR) repeat protein